MKNPIILSVFEPFYSLLNEPFWIYANTEELGIRPSQYQYFGIAKIGWIPVSGIPGIAIPNV